VTAVHANLVNASGKPKAAGWITAFYSSTIAEMSSECLPNAFLENPKDVAG
jgi:hypothetical protein